MNDPLIFGKSDLKRIVSLEAQDGAVECFIEEIDGTVRSEHLPNKYWLLSPKPLNNKFVKLKGSLYYNYGIQFNTHNEYSRAKVFWRHNDTYSIYDSKESTMVNRGLTSFKGMMFGEPSILSFDIETTGLKHDNTSKLLLISNTFRKLGTITRKLFSYDEYDSEGDMILAWCSWIREMNPSIITGYNIYSFDIPYITFCAARADVNLSLGRDGSSLKFSKYTSQFRIDGSREQEYKKCTIYGREIVDGYFLAIKYDVSRKYESYRLKSIIAHEGLEVKGRVFYDASKIRDNYKDPVEFQKIKDYCIFDSDDALALYDLMGASYFYMAQSIPKSFTSIMTSASGSQINSMMVRSYLQEGHSLPKADNAVPFEGAISYGPPGIYRNMLKLDVSSLYPSIIREHNIYNVNKDPKGNFLKLVDYFTLQRLENKKLAAETGNKYYNDLQESQKILINSMYGFLSTSGLLFNSPVHAAEITEKGRNILKKAIVWATGKTFEELYKTEIVEDEE